MTKIEEASITWKEELTTQDAYHRANELLRSHLNDQQREEWDRKRSFVIRSRKRLKKRRYHIDGSRILYRSHDGYGHNRCYDVVGCWVPLPDRALAQKLALETNERKVLNEACGY